MSEVVFDAPTIGEIESALFCIGSDLPRDDWARIGMAIKSELGDAGFDLFDTWSQGAGDLFSAEDVRSTWRSINGGGGIKIATLFHFAIKAGYEPAKKPANLLVDETARLKRRQERQAANDLEEAARRKQYETAALGAQERWNKAKPATDHPYLVRKGIKPHGARQEGDNLLIPMRDADRSLRSLQTIAPDGTKKFAKGCRASGMYAVMPGTSPLVIAEGFATAASINEATGCRVAVAFSCSNLMSTAEQLREKHPDEKIIIAADSEPQSTTDKARDVALAICAGLAIPSVASDFNDLQREAGMEAVKVEIESGQEPEASPPDLEELAKLSPMEYDKTREGKAKELGIRVGTLDKEVAKHRAEIAEETEDDVVEELSPWPDPVDGSVLLAEIREQMLKHVVMQKGCPTAAAVWALGSFCIDAFRLFPKLQIKSPEKRCGKSTLMEYLEGVTSRPLMTSNITASSLFRCIEAWRPTLLIDEADTFAVDNDELNGIINAGHTRRHAFVIRTVKENDTHRPRKFCVWGAQVIAGIKNQRDTLEDRSITVEMRRKKPDEKTQKITVDYFDSAQPLRRKCLRWTTDNIGSLKASRVEAPPCGNDRAQDNWTPLFAVAAIAGGEWPRWVEAAYRLIEVSNQDDSASTMLLEDIKQVFDDKDRERIHSENLVAALVAMDDRPWAEWKHGKPMTKASLSRLLKPFKIKPKKIRVGDANLQGYERIAFQDAFDRYLSQDPPFQSGTTEQSSAGAGFSGFQSGTRTLDVPLSNPEKPNEINECSSVPLQNPDLGGGGGGAGDLDPEFEEMNL